MYVHVGEDVMVRTDEIIAILDKNSVQASEDIKQFLQQKEKMVQNLAKNAFKSLVITNKEIYLSPLASTTLKKRSTKGNRQFNP
ncbi:extracellular matrix regulator RemB [Falsibacillus pallidus]|uniref:Uncharacterized protein DUF370 n=1 Tax=Falsibacillus pallidus TaxID=493781 RepID=A0A370GCF1_9BACI|nr:extracellular matrix/biofilm biosynthesis regulator RemA family protein [Falsibacillus pallidus]RDI40866.1 uncharacterized protein DUF370 [Falsibacillus pallidus]